MTRQEITARVLNCTPRELQDILDIFKLWKSAFDDELAGEVKTAREIIDLLDRPEYREAFAAENVLP